MVGKDEMPLKFEFKGLLLDPSAFTLKARIDLVLDITELLKENIALPPSLYEILEKQQFDVLCKLTKAWMGWYGEKSKSKIETFKEWTKSPEFRDKVKRLVKEVSQVGHKERGESVRTRVARELAKNSKQLHYAILSSTGQTRRHLRDVGVKLSLHLKGPIKLALRGITKKISRKVIELLKKPGISTLFYKVVDLFPFQIDNLRLSDVIGAAISVRDP